MAGCKFTDIEFPGVIKRRNVNWSDVRSEIDTGLSAKTREELEQLKVFFEKHRGPGFGFRFKDWEDFQNPLNELDAGFESA